MRVAHHIDVFERLDVEVDNLGMHPKGSAAQAQHSFPITESENPQLGQDARLGAVILGR